MEVKRVLGVDSRTATAEAVKLYGKEALIISNERINGKVEVIVAVDLERDQFKTLEPDGIDSRRQAMLMSADSAGAASAPKRGGGGFGDILHSQLGEMTIPPALKTKTEFGAFSEKEADRQELDHAKDLVSMLREEFAEMRKELRISQQLGAWQSTPDIAEAVKPLANALLASGVPVELRSLLVDEIKGLDDLGEAMSVVESVLQRSIQREKQGRLLQGVNVISGPSGAGKTMMVGRLAAMHARDGAFQCDEVAVVSFNDRRAGAWNQIQLLAAKAGVDSYRVTDQATLENILPELELRKVVLIDTPGVRVPEHLDAIANVVNKGEEKVRFHLLLPADASAATIKRYLDQPNAQWETLMLSKMDESTQPWPLIQALCECRLPLSFSSSGPAGLESLATADTDMLVRLAMSNLPVQGPATGHSDRLALANAQLHVWRSGRKELQ